MVRRKPLYVMSLAVKELLEQLSQETVLSKSAIHLLRGDGCKRNIAFYSFHLRERKIGYYADGRHPSRPVIGYRMIIVCIHGVFYFLAEEQCLFVETLFRFGTANLELEVGNNQAGLFSRKCSPSWNESARWIYPNR